MLCQSTAPRSQIFWHFAAILVAAMLFFSARSAHAAYQVSAWTFGDATSFTNAANAGAIDEISVDWYESQSNLRVNAIGEDLNFVHTAQSRGVRVLATVSDYSNKSGNFMSAVSTAVFRSQKSMTTHIAAIVDLCVSKGYDGIDIDWEAVLPKNKAKFSSFIAQLSAALHARSKILSMAIAPKLTEPGDWSAPQSEDYAALGAVVDEFKLMTYDYSGSWSAPGPISPLDWMDAALTHAESLVPADKIMAGIPFYGYNWLGKTTTDVLWTDAQNLIATYAPTITRDPSGEATFTYTDKKGKLHTVFYQDRTAVADKLQMLRSKHAGIKGIAIWVMGGEDPTFWDEIELQMH